MTSRTSALFVIALLFVAIAVPASAQSVSPKGTTMFEFVFSDNTFSESNFANALSTYFGQASTVTWAKSNIQFMYGFISKIPGPDPQQQRFQFTLYDANQVADMVRFFSRADQKTALQQLKNSFGNVALPNVYLVSAHMYTSAGPASNDSSSKSFVGEYGLFIGIGIGVVILVVIAVAVVVSNRRAAEHQRLQDVMEAMNEANAAGRGDGSDSAAYSSMPKETNKAAPSPEQTV